MPPPWRTFCFGAQAIVIPLAIIWILGRSWSAYGFRVGNMRSIIHYGFAGAMLMMIVGMGFGFLKSQRIDPRGMSGSLLMSAIAVVVVCLFVILTRTSGEPDDPGSPPFRIGYKVAILCALVACPIVVAIVRNADVYEMIAWDAYFLVMVGLGESLLGLALASQAVGDYEDADRLLARAIAILEDTFGAQHPESANALLEMATLRARQGRDDEAERLYQRSVAILKASTPGLETYQVAYSQACYWAALGRRDEALRYLERSLELGYSKPFFVNPSFDPLRGDPDYEAIVTAFRVGRPGRE